MRLYDAKAGQWNITWCSAVSGVPICLRGGQEGERIVLLGKDVDGSMLLWSFNDVSAERFIGRGEISKDNGLTWRIEQTINAQRSKPAFLSHPRILHAAWVRTDRVGLEVAEVRIASAGSVSRSSAPEFGATYGNLWPFHRQLAWDL